VRKLDDLFNHLVGAREHGRRNVDAQRLRGLKVDQEGEFCRQHHRQFRRLLTLYNPAAVGGNRFALLLNPTDSENYNSTLGDVHAAAGAQQILVHEPQTQGGPLEVAVACHRAMKVSTRAVRSSSGFGSPFAIGGNIRAYEGGPHGE
jgi:hypothetical protein